jgi:hypothetical protein
MQQELREKSSAIFCSSAPVLVNMFDKNQCSISGKYVGMYNTCLSQILHLLDTEAL